jgi:hypothetical protein
MKRQGRNCRMRPEMVGPIAGATEMTMLTIPMTWPRRATGTSVRTLVMSSGSMTAVPHAWTTRATRRTGNPGASAARSVPALKKLIARMKTLLRASL